MTKTAKWVMRAIAVTTVVAVATRAYRSVSGTSPGGGGLLPTIGSDTWPPVPSKPDGPVRPDARA